MTSEILFISSSEVPGAAVAATSAVSSWNGQEVLAHFRIQRERRDDDHEDDAEHDERLAEAETQQECFPAAISCHG
jgi:aspartate carbamoyltransferase catalytic subunit